MAPRETAGHRYAEEQIDGPSLARKQGTFGLQCHATGPETGGAITTMASHALS